MGAEIGGKLCRKWHFMVAMYNHVIKYFTASTVLTGKTAIKKMDEGYLSSSTTPKIQLSKPSGGATSSGLTLLIPSLKSLKAAKKFKDPPTPISTTISTPANANLESFFQDVDVNVNVNVVDGSSIQGEKKIARPVKLKPLKEVLTKLIAQIKKYASFHLFIYYIIFIYIL